ncbi:MAG TPA: DNA-directed RNA polymerase subunit beta', partial [Candidatus Bipolaricaulota bacterium]
MFVSGDDISRLRIGLASPDEMRKWSKGEVTESETINYRTHRPERGGLFAEEIFGPENDFECGCGKYRGRKYEGIKCEKCGVFVTDKSVRRVNMGHINLASPVVHFWYLKGVSSPLSTLLGVKRVTLKRIAYYETESRQEELFIVTESADDDTMLGEILSKTQLGILQLKKKFKAEPAFLIESSPAVVAGVAGKVAVVPMRLENGEEIAMVRVDDKEYPLSPQADVLVRSGEVVKAGAVLAESPFGRSEELISEFKFNALRQFHPQIKGAKAVDTVDNLLYLVTVVRGADFPKQVGDLLLEDERYAYERVYRGQFEAHTGALGIQGVLANYDLNRLSKQLKFEINAEPSEGKRKRLLKRLEIVEHLRNSGNRPQDMVLEVIPVMPPNLRPIVQLEGGKFATTDLNDLYRRIINRNNRLKKLKEMGAPEVILRNERRMLQEAVDALIYNEKKENPILGRDNRPLKSLSERISGKQGRLRRNLLGKRVDYSGRAVIVVNPKLKLHQCGLPKKMALELFRPFIHQQLQLLEKQVPITNYDELKNKALSGEMPEVWDVLDRVIKDHPVLLNRAPTLHRLGIQAFEPILVDGEAIQIHPFVCTPYNADFDGDTMSVHVPLYPAAIREARELMLSAKNILSPASGEPLSMPTQDFIFVVYYLTAPPQQGKGSSKRLLAFADEIEAQRAYEEGYITLQSLIQIRFGDNLLKTTLGRVLFNRILPPDLRDFERVFDSGAVRSVIMTCYHTYGNDRVVQLLEDLKELGLEYGARSGLTISVRDCLIPEQKPTILAAARSRVLDINGKFDEGLSTDAERKEAVIKVWRETVDKMEDHTME